MNLIINVLHHPLTLLTALAGLDVVTGVFRAKQQDVFATKKLKYGLITHTLVLIGIGLLGFYAQDYELTSLVYPVRVGFALMYILSILENYRAIGGTLPDNLEKMLNSKVVEKKKDEDG